MNHKWTHELLERAKHSPDAVDPYARLDFWHTRPDESILLSTYDALTNTWSSSTHTARVEATPFAKGSMRTCYRMKKLSHFIVPATWENASAYVIKSYTNSNDVELNRDMVKMDIRVQMMAKLYAQWFNETQPPKKIDVMQVVMIEFPDRPGNPCFCGERFLAGQYIKYNSNVGFIDDHRNTPQAFSHFTFERSSGQHLVVDIQGVGDLYTDPQIHSLDDRDFGEGNLGLSGYALFFHTHRCNSICRHLDLKPFEHYPYLKTASSMERNDPEFKIKSESDTIAEHSTLDVRASLMRTRWRAQSKLSCSKRATDIKSLVGAVSHVLEGRSQIKIDPEWVMAQMRAMMDCLPVEHAWRNNVRHAIKLMQPVVDDWTTDSQGQPAMLDKSQTPSNSEHNLHHPQPTQMNASSEAALDQPMDLVKLDRVIGQVHRRIAHHFLSNDVPFSVPASLGEIPNIILFHYHQAADHHCIEAALCLSNLYADLPCDELLASGVMQQAGYQPKNARDLVSAVVYAQRAALDGSRLGWLKVAHAYDPLRHIPLQRTSGTRAGVVLSVGTSMLDERDVEERKKLPDYALRALKAYEAYEKVLAIPDWTNEDVASQSYELTLATHEFLCQMARLKEHGGYGLKKDARVAKQCWERAAEDAEMGFEAKRALIYYEQAARLMTEFGLEADDAMDDA